MMIISFVRIHIPWSGCVFLFFWRSVARDGGVGSDTLLVIVLVVAGRVLVMVFLATGFIDFLTSLLLLDGVFGVGIFGVAMKVKIRKDKVILYYL